MTDTDMEDTGHSHPGVGQYVEIGVILAVVTAVEVGLYYIDVSRGFTVPALLFLTFMKFALVVLWFMHLRFDSRILRRLFVTGIVLAASVYAIVLIITLFNRRTGAEGLTG